MAKKAKKQEKAEDDNIRLAEGTAYRNSDSKKGEDKVAVWVS